MSRSTIKRVLLILLTVALFLPALGAPSQALGNHYIRLRLFNDDGDGVKESGENFGYGFTIAGGPNLSPSLGVSVNCGAYTSFFNATDVNGYIVLVEAPVGQSLCIKVRAINPKYCFTWVQGSGVAYVHDLYLSIGNIGALDQVYGLSSGLNC
jgi:hypothetical protein